MSSTFPPTGSESSPSAKSSSSASNDRIVISHDELSESASEPVTDEAPIQAQAVGFPVNADLVESEHEVINAEPAVAEAELVEERSVVFQVWRTVCGGVDWLFGLASLLCGLAVLAAIPVVQFLSFGYLLESSGRIARTGKFRSGFIGIKTAARAGSMVLGTWLWLWPIRYVSSLWYASNLIDAESTATQNLRMIQVIVTVLLIGHILAVWYCGGKLRYFFWPFIAPFSFGIWLARSATANKALRPLFDGTLGAVSPRLLNDIRNCKPLTDWFLPAILVKGLLSGGMYARARDGVWDFVMNLRLPYYFWLGARGFAGSITWLGIPVLLIVAAVTATEVELIGIGVLCMFFGFVSLSVVVLYLPFLEAHFAAENRFSAMFEIGPVRRAFKHAPIAFWFSLLITLAFAVPLYLLKIEFAPTELAWVLCLAFVIMIYPSRLFVGWAIARGRERVKNLATGSFGGPVG